MTPFVMHTLERVKAREQFKAADSSLEAINRFQPEVAALRALVRARAITARFHPGSRHACRPIDCVYNIKLL